MPPAYKDSGSGGTPLTISCGAGSCSVAATDGCSRIAGAATVHSERRRCYPVPQPSRPITAHDPTRPKPQPFMESMVKWKPGSGNALSRQSRVDFSRRTISAPLWPLLHVGWLYAGALSAASGQPADVETAPGLYPAVTAGLVANDNILAAESGERSDTLYVLAPALIYRLPVGKHLLEIGYDGEYAAYDHYSTENYVDHNAAGELTLDLTPRLGIEAGAGYRWSHDRRGASGSQTLLSTEPDRWEESRLFGKLIYGRRTSRGQVAVAARSTGLRFTNNGQQGRDRDTQALAATFFYNLGAVTSASLELSRADVDYVSASDHRDSTETRLLIGAQWEMTGLTTGKLQLGGVEKDFDNAQERDFSGFTLTAEVTWEPRPTDRIDITVSREPRESTRATASYYIANSAAVSWSSALTDLVTFSASMEIQTDNYSDDREDDLITAGYGLIYDLTDRLDVAGSYTLRSRDSNQIGLDYDVNVFMITLTYQPPR